MKHRSSLRLLSCALTFALITPAVIQAQDALKFPAPSPAAKVSQTVGLTDIDIVYSRPALRGRQAFGNLAPYGEVWRTGANSSTKITFSSPVVFGGTEVPAGTYALYSVPGMKSWEVILSRNTELWGSYGYVPDQEAARVTVTPVKLSAPVESFTLSIDDVVDDAATLNLTWENVRVPVVIEADTKPILLPQIKAVMASDAEKKPYFMAAMYLYSEGVMLDQAAEWINEAAKLQPDAFWLIYRQGLVLAAAGDKAGAKAAAMKSLAMLEKMDEGEIKAEYTRLNEALLASLKSGM